MPPQSLSESNQNNQSSPADIAENLPNYSGLDEFIADASKTGETSESVSEKTSESSESTSGMSEEDCLMIAGGGVEKFEWLASAYVGAEVTIPEKQKEDVATKAAAVIKKHFGNAELPPWLKQWKEEISLGLALGTCAITIYRQKKIVDAELAKESGETSESKAENVEKVSAQSFDFQTGAPSGH